MSESYDNLAEEFAKLSQPTLPVTLWDYVARQCPPELRERNQFDIEDHFNFALYDSSALVEATLYANDAFSDVTPLYVFNGKKTSMSAAQITAYYATREAHAISLTKLEWERMLRDSYSKDDLFRMLNEKSQYEAIRRIMPSMTELQGNNLNQHVRNTMAEVWASTADSFKLLCRKAYHHWQDEGKRLSLRHPVAMNAAQVPTLLGSSPLSGIPQLESYMSKSQLMFFELIRDFDSNMLEFFTPPASDQPIPQRNRLYAHQWLGTGANAMLRDGNTSQILTRRNLPPWLTLHSTSRFAVRVDPVVSPTSLLYDEVQEIVIHDVESLQYEGSLFPPRRFSQVDALLTQVIAMGFTLMATQIKLGSGNRKPSWLHTPMNRASISVYAHKLKEALDYAL